MFYLHILCCNKNLVFQFKHFEVAHAVYGFQYKRWTVEVTHLLLRECLHHCMVSQYNLYSLIYLSYYPCHLMIFFVACACCRFFPLKPILRLEMTYDDSKFFDI